MSELLNFLDAKAHDLQSNLDKYDGLVVIIIARGFNNYVVTSDNKLISKIAISRIFTAEWLSNRKIPRVFLFDTTRGWIRTYVRTPGVLDIVEVSYIHQGLNFRFKGTHRNPDSNLCVWEATKHKSQMEQEPDIGRSCIITQFTKILGNNIGFIRSLRWLWEIVDMTEQSVKEETRNQTKTMFITEQEQSMFNFYEEQRKIIMQLIQI